MLEALFWDHNRDFQSATAAAAVALIGNYNFSCIFLVKL